MNPIVDNWLRVVHSTGTEIAITLLVNGRVITGMRRIIVAQSLYALGAALCVINTSWSIGFIVAVQLNYAIAPRWLARLTA